MSLQNDMLNNERESNSEHLKIIKQLFHPKSVAVIGASTTRLKGGYRILENLVGNKFEGAIYPINPKGGEALGLKFYKSLDEISDPIDIAIIFVPNRLIPGILNECIKKGIRGAIIEAAGFEEVGEAGLKLRDEVVKVTDNFKKIRIVGPNCTGLTRVDSSESGFFSAFIRHYNYRRGNVAIISQSGMVNGGYFNYLNTTYENMRVKYVASIGNKMDLGENEFLEYYLEDEDVQVIPIYLESFKDPRKFIELCSRRNYEDGGKNNKNTIKSGNKRRKSIILLKGGITEQ
ncbi:MAG: CoA-binding protein, partial [Promethearchaeota archaeon]